MIYLLDCFVLLGALTLLALMPSIVELLEDVFFADPNPSPTTSPKPDELRDEIVRLTTVLEKGTPLPR